MYISDLFRGLLRRWYVMLAGFILTAASAYLVFDAAPVQYESNATMMLLPPDESLGVQVSNPYLVLGGMGQALAVLTTRLNSPETRDRVLGDAEDADYGAAADTTAGAPFLSLTAQAPSESESLELLAVVKAEAEAHLAVMQTELDIPTASEIGIMQVTSDIEATKLGTTQLQLTLATVAVGLVLTVLAAAMVDGLVNSRTRKRAAALIPRRRERGPREPLSAREVVGRGVRAPDTGDGPADNGDPGGRDDLGDSDDLDAVASGGSAAVPDAGRSADGRIATQRARHR